MLTHTYTLTHTHTQHTNARTNAHTHTHARTGEAAALHTEDVPACEDPIFAATATHSALLPLGLTLTPEALAAATNDWSASSTEHTGVAAGAEEQHQQDLVFEVRCSCLITLPYVRLQLHRPPTQPSQLQRKPMDHFWCWVP